jgi:hypothetical protein
MRSQNYNSRIYFSGKSNVTQTNSNSQLGFKEILFLSAILGWTSIGYIFGKIFSSSKSKSRLSTIFFLTVLPIGLIIFGLSNNLDTFSIKTFGCYIFVIWLVAFDCQRQQFYANVTIHPAKQKFLAFHTYKY